MSADSSPGDDDDDDDDNDGAGRDVSTVLQVVVKMIANLLRSFDE